jgi:hypothetical protein
MGTAAEKLPDYFTSADEVSPTSHVDIQAAGAWSLAGDVADGLADAVPLEHLLQNAAADAPPTLYDIDLTAASSSGRAGTTQTGATPADTTAGA